MRRGWRVRTDVIATEEIRGDSPLAAVAVLATPYRLHALIGVIIAASCGAGFLTWAAPGLAPWRTVALLPFAAAVGVLAYRWTVRLTERYGDRRHPHESEPDGRLWRPHLRLILPVAAVLGGAILVIAAAQTAILWPYGRLGPSCSWVTVVAVFTPVFTLWRAREIRSRAQHVLITGSDDKGEFDVHTRTTDSDQNRIDYLADRARARELVRGREDGELRAALCGEEGRELAARLAAAANLTLMSAIGNRFVETRPLEMSLDVYAARAVADPRLAARDAAERSVVLDTAAGYSRDVVPVAEFHRLHPGTGLRLSDSLVVRYPAYGEEPGPAVPSGTQTILLDLAPRFAQAWAGFVPARRQVETAIRCVRVDSGSVTCPFADALGLALAGRMEEAVLIEGVEQWERSYLYSLKMVRESLGGARETP
ncbi:hypothetical protein Afil01_65780 [Actinorhabdospora filicis]|uniref:Uncharacterized protein n=1 Tax=Actinorhabdospora filicis TaxID=1785913 RepID=A0A9W6WDM8_9ACTN|nr:hypothetical protein [Actinorhabdospora filicis]GLZ81771.1 hypothetical protein Afil01_65780 [Actinorhabdospora filicis]